jgi:hypothetical protein
MRFFHGLLLACVAGCAVAPLGAEMTLEANGEASLTLRVLASGSCHLEDASLSREDDGWELAGRVRYRGKFLLSRTDRTFRLSAVTAEGATVFSTFVIARELPATTRYKASRHASFRAPIPDPAGFDHLVLALGASPEEGEEPP